MQSQTHQVHQKFQLKSLFSEEIDEAKQPLEQCQKCSFTLLNEICYACNQKQVKIEKVEVKNKRWVQKIHNKGEKTLYIFCLDNSGSVQVDYNIEDAGKEIQSYDISDLENFVNNKEDFAKLKELGDRVLYQNMAYIKDFISMGVSAQDVVLSLGSQKNKPAKKVETRKSRKLIMKQIMVSILNELKTKDNCDVIVLFFNQQIMAQGIEKVYLNFSEKQEKQVYSIGKQNAKMIKKYCSKQFNECSQLFKNQKYQPNGGTALGPALVFCCGLVSQLKYAHNQIILITDGASNTGFGDLQSVQNKQNSPHAYKVSQEYASIATNYFIPNNISMNLLAYQDSEIKYYILNKFFNMTGSKPILLDVVEKKTGGVNDKHVSSKKYQTTRDTFKYQVIDQPTQCSKYLKIAFICSDSSIKLQNRTYGKKGYGSIFLTCGRLNISKQNLHLILSSSKQISSLPPFTLTVLVHCFYKQNQIRVIYTKQYNLIPKKPNINQETKKKVTTTNKQQEGEMLSYKSDNHSISFRRNNDDYEDDDNDNY